jgi:hypothetical protein
VSKVFTTTSDYLNVNTAVVTTPAFTLHCWIKQSVLGNAENYVSIGTIGSGNNRFFLQKTSADDLVHATERDTTSGQANSAIAITDTTNWHCVTGVFTSDSSRTVYLDGGNSGSNATARTPTTPDSLYLGRNQSGTASMFQGKMAYVAIWNRALTSTEVADLAIKTPLAAAPSGLVAYYPLLADGNDQAGSNNLTVNGAAGWDTDMPPIVAAFPAAALLVVSGLAPTLGRERTVAPGAGLLSMLGLAPVQQTATVIPDSIPLTVLGQVPTIQVTGLPTSAFQPAALSLVGLAPTTLRTRVIVTDLQTGDADENGLAPTILTEWTSRPVMPSQPLTMQGLVPIIVNNGNTYVIPVPGLLTMAGLQITSIVPAGQSGTVTPGAGLVQFLNPEIGLLSSRTVTPGPAQLTISSENVTTVEFSTWHNPAPISSRNWHNP